MLDHLQHAKFPQRPTLMLDRRRSQDFRFCPGPMAKLLSEQEFSRFDELQKKQSDFSITIEEADELREIVLRAQQKRESRAAAMIAIDGYILQFDVSPEELFTREQIADAARAFGLLSQVKKKRPVESVQAEAEADPA